MAMEAAPLLGVWLMTTALFFVVAAVGIAFGLLVGYAIGVLSRHQPRQRLATNRLDALDQMMRVQEYIKRGELGTAARELGISDRQADAWTYEQLTSHIEVRLQALVKKATG
jgi:hypothetical protein